MNRVKIISPDFLTGKILVVLRSLFDSVCMVISHPSKESLKFVWRVLQIKPKFTMVKNDNLRILYDLVREANKSRLVGDIVECGVWNGGSAAIMAFACMDDSRQVRERTIWLFDSFQGLPPPGLQDGELENQRYFEGWNRGSVELVKEIFDKIEFPSERIRIVPGWFNETLHGAQIKDIMLLHIDADWYDSVKIALEAFFDHVVPGGYIVFDDYGYWPGCSRALTDFFSKRGIQEIAVKRVGRHGAYLQKPPHGAMLSGDT